MHLQVPPDTHRVVICVQVGHEHRSEGAQDPVHVISVVTAQLPKRTFTTVQQQGLVRATEGSETFVTDRKGLWQLRGLLL